MKFILMNSSISYPRRLKMLLKLRMNLLRHSGDGRDTGGETGFYEKVINVKADVAAVLVSATKRLGVVVNTVKGVPQDVHLDP